MWLKNFFKEFRDFATKGNIIDLAVGIMIGAAFNSVVNALVKDVMTPPIGFLLHQVNFNDMYVSLNGQHYQNLAAAQAANAPVIMYGDFLNTLISFLITAFTIFLIVKQVNAWRHWREHHKTKEAPAAPTTKKCPFCFTDIPVQASRCPHCTSQLEHK